MASDLLSGRHGYGRSCGISPGQEGAAAEDLKRTQNWGGGVHLSVREGGGVRGRRGEGMLQQQKADASEVKLFWEAGGVSGPGGEAVGVGGRAEEGQVTLTGST